MRFIKIISIQAKYWRLQQLSKKMEENFCAKFVELVIREVETQHNERVQLRSFCPVPWLLYLQCQFHDWTKHMLAIKEKQWKCRNGHSICHNRWPRHKGRCIARHKGRCIARHKGRCIEARSCWRLAEEKLQY